MHFARIFPYAVNELNEFYASIHSSTYDDNNNCNLIMSNYNGEPFHFQPINFPDVENAIKNISSNAIGFDGISLKFLKIILPYFMDVIVHIINYSLIQNIFPSLWNKAIIKPIGKINEPKNVADTRPIVLNSVMTKITSSIFNNQLRNHIENNNLLTEFQSGFRNKHSCTTNSINASFRRY